MASVNQIKRLLGLLDHLQSEDAYNARQLAEKVGVSRRTLFRDLRALDKLGFGVRYDERASRYIVEGDASTLTGEGADDRTDDLKTLMDLGQRLEGAPDELKTRIAELPRLIELRSGSADSKSDAALFGNIIEALCNRRKLRVMRSRSDGGSQVVSLSPYRLTFSQAAWHLVGDADTFGPDSMPMSEVVRADVTDETFVMPEADAIDALVERVVGGTSAEEPLGDVVVQFAPEIARGVAERRWFRTQELEWLDDGRLELRTTGGEASRVLKWVLSFGADASVVQPEALRTRVAKHASRMAALYRTSV